MKKTDRKKLKTSKIDKLGREINNPKALFIPVSDRKSLKERIQMMIRSELSNHFEDKGMESFEEANDFEVESEFDEELEQTSYQMQDEMITKSEESKSILDPQEPIQNALHEEQEKKRPTGAFSEKETPQDDLRASQAQKETEKVSQIATNPNDPT